jgi:negative regulator of flagellin synthesis FlgM
MKINPSAANNSAQSAGVSSASQADRAAQAANAKKRGAVATETKVSDNGSSKSEISGKARDMAQAKSVAQSSPDVREDKVAALRARIAEGKYSVDAQKVADRLVDQHLETATLG